MTPSAEAENQPERVVEVAKFRRRQAAAGVAKTGRVNSAKLVREDPCRLAGQLDLRVVTKRARIRPAIALSVCTRHSFAGTSLSTATCPGVARRIRTRSSSRR